MRNHLPRLGAVAAWTVLVPIVSMSTVQSQPVEAGGITLTASACPEAGTGVFANRRWSRCGPATLGDGSVAMEVTTDAEGSGTAMKPRPDSSGARCRVVIAAGTLKVIGPRFEASATLSGRPGDNIVRTNDGRTFVNAGPVVGDPVVTLEFDPKEGIVSALGKLPGRALTCMLP